MGSINAKLDLVLEAMKNSRGKEDSEADEVIKTWTDDIAEAWVEVKPRGRARVKPTKLKHKPCSPSTSSLASSADLQTEGETKPLRTTNLKGHLRSYMFVLKCWRK